MIPWYLKYFVLPFLKPHYSWDINADVAAVITAKIWRGKIYIVEEKVVFK